MKKAYIFIVILFIVAFNFSWGKYPYDLPSPLGAEHTGYWIDYYSSSFSGGDGSQANPYKIATPGELARLAYLIKTQNSVYTSCHYELINNIDLNGHYWTPIAKREFGGDDIYFQGTFNGNNYKIYNVYINTSGGHSVGFFAYTEGAFISNVTLVNPVILPRALSLQAFNAGILVGLARNTSIKRIKIFDANLKVLYTYNTVGGIVGNMFSNGGTPSITKCFISITSNVKSDANFGCIAGQSDCFINECHVIATMSENFCGIVGEISANFGNVYVHLDGNASNYYAFAKNQTGGTLINGVTVNAHTYVGSGANLRTCYTNPKTLPIAFPTATWGISSYINGGRPHLKCFYWEDNI